MALVGGNYQASISTTALPAGLDSITAVIPATADLPTGSSQPFTQTVTPAPVTVTAENATTTYGTTNPTLPYTVSGLLNGDTAAAVFSGSLATTATPASSVGQYAITRGTLTPNGNYAITSFTGATLTVTPAPLTIVANNATRVIDGQNPTFTFTVQGLQNGDSSAVVTGVTLGTTAVQSSPIGTYPINASGNVKAGPNYRIVSLVPGVLIDHPRPDELRRRLGRGAGPVPRR